MKEKYDSIRVEGENAANETLSELESLIVQKDENAIKDYISVRVADLIEQAVPSWVNGGNFPKHEGFLHPETTVRANFFQPPVVIDDHKIYEEVVDALAVYRAVYEGKPMADIIFIAVQRAVSAYLGNNLGQASLAANEAIYGEHAFDAGVVSIKEFRHKAAAVCVERASVAQNMLSFLGVQSSLVASQCTLDEGRAEGHMYNVVTTSKGVCIFDPTNPRLIFKQGTQEVVGYSPELFPLTSEQVQELDLGGEVLVSHVNYDVDEHGKHTPRFGQNRIYRGPKVSGGGRPSSISI